MSGSTSYDKTLAIRGTKAADRAILDVAIQRLTEFANATPSSRRRAPGKISDLKHVLAAAASWLGSLDHIAAPKTRMSKRAVEAETKLALIHAELHNFELNGSNAVLQIRGIYSDLESASRKRRGKLADGRRVVKVGETFYIEAKITTGETP